MAGGLTKDKSDERPLEGISLVVDHAIRFMPSRYPTPTTESS